MSGITLGNMTIGGGVPEVIVKSFLMLSGKVICFEEEFSQDIIWWKMPLILENAMKGQEVQTFFRPLIPLGPETKFRQIDSSTMICEIIDPNLKQAYLDMCLKIRAHMSGIDTSGSSGIVLP